VRVTRAPPLGLRRPPRGPRKVPRPEGCGVLAPRPWQKVPPPRHAALVAAVRARPRAVRPSLCARPGRGDARRRARCRRTRHAAGRGRWALRALLVRRRRASEGHPMRSHGAAPAFPPVPAGRVRVRRHRRGPTTPGTRRPRAPRTATSTHPHATRPTTPVTTHDPAHAACLTSLRRHIPTALPSSCYFCFRPFSLQARLPCREALIAHPLEPSLGSVRGAFPVRRWQDRWSYQCRPSARQAPWAHPHDVRPTPRLQPCHSLHVVVGRWTW
jgi:hypothetical protein